MTTETPTTQLRWHNHIFININWFALILRTHMLSGLLVPLLVLKFVGEAQKGSYFGTIRLWALLVALIMQALFGLLSDRSRSKWGRRRPFIFVGTVLEVLVIASMIWIAQLEGSRGYTVLFVAYIFSMALANMSQAGTQGLIPDVVPQEKRGISSGIKMLLEVPLPLAVIGLVIAPMFGDENYVSAVLVVCGIMLACMGLTMLVREKPLESEAPPLDWKPFISLVLMTTVFAVIILGLGEVVKFLIATIGEQSVFIYGGIGVIAMFVAVVVGIFASLAVHLDQDVRKNTSFIWLVISRLAALVAVNNLATYLLYFFQEKFNLPANEAAELAGVLPMALGATILVFAPAAGWLSDRFDRRLLTALAGLIGAIGVAVMVLGGTISMMYVAAVILGLAFVLYNVASWALSTDIIPTERAGEFLGLQNLAGAGAGAIGAYIGGTIADHSGYILMMSMFVVMLLLSAVAAFFIKPRQSEWQAIHYPN